MYWNIIWIFLIVSALCCIIGFKRIVYFLSIGYGFSVFGLGIAYLVVSIVNNTFDIIGLIQVILICIYGFRLSFFLLKRELKNASYKKVLEDATKNSDSSNKLFIKIIIWISVAILYFLQTCPIFFRAQNGNIWQFGQSFNSSAFVMPVIGIVISIIGLLLEGISDWQKSKQKAVRQDMVATKGLYKICRTPNYFGERIFWLGIFLGGITSYNCAWQWVSAILGYVLIFYVMINSAKRLGKKQDNRYGKMEEYNKYIETTPLYFPYAPRFIVRRIYNKKKEKQNKE